MRSIPSIEQLRQRPALLALESTYGRSAIVDALRAEAAAVRQQAGDAASSDDLVVTIERQTIQRLASVGAIAATCHQRNRRDHSYESGTRTARASGGRAC